jgi:hypothetical protein
MIKLPNKPDPEDVTRELIIGMLPLALPGVVTYIRVRSSKRTGEPIVTLNLLVDPSTNGLVPFRVYYSRKIVPEESLPNGWTFKELQETLGKVEVPWGTEISEEAAVRLFQEWVGKRVLVHLEGDTFMHEARIRANRLEVIK